MLHRGLEGVGATELRIDDDELDGPVYGNGQGYEENDAREHSCLSKSVGLAYDARTAVSSLSARTLPWCNLFSYMMLLAMFMKADLIPLFGRALSSKSSALKSFATVTDGASIPVSSGTL